MTLLFTIPAKDNNTLKVYRWASTHCAKLVSKMGFTLEDCIPAGTDYYNWQEVLKFCHKYQEL